MHDTDSAALERFLDLFPPLEDLIRRIADSEDPNIRRMRAKVRAELVSLQNNMSGAFADSRHSANSSRSQAPVLAQASASAPWMEPAIVALTAAAVALTLHHDDC